MDVIFLYIIEVFNNLGLFVFFWMYNLMLGMKGLGMSFGRK